MELRTLLRAIYEALTEVDPGALTRCVTRHYVTRRHNHVLIEHVKRAPPKICLASLFLDVHHHGLDQYIFRMQSER